MKIGVIGRFHSQILQKQSSGIGIDLLQSIDDRRITLEEHVPIQSIQINAGYDGTFICDRRLRFDE